MGDESSTKKSLLAQMAFSVCSKLKENMYPNIQRIIAVPFENQYIKWSAGDIVRYKLQLQVADEVILVDELKNIRYKNPNLKIKEFAAEKMQNRNEWMVDHSNYAIVVWDGTNGGPANCIKYIRKQIVSSRMVV